MNPRDALADGQLGEAINLQHAAVSAAPADPAARLFLFELLTLAGRFAEARDQLDLVASDDPAWPDARLGFVHILRAARRREAGRRPRFILDPPRHARRRWNAALALRRERTDAATTWIDRADVCTPEFAGHIDGREFQGLRDTDDRFASVLEAFSGGAYLWVPFDQLRRVTLSPPAGVLDAAYRPAAVSLIDGQQLAAVLPLVYPGSGDAEGAFAAGLDTDWPDAGGPTCGVGARVLMVGDEELTLGDCRQLDVRPG